ncbi:MAG: CHAT domain-containing protein [Anaerolineae bacterium]|nr:CHAT domain-containing protein [Anaerolineae bacterium]
MEPDQLAKEIGNLFFALTQASNDATQRKALITELKAQADFYGGKDPRVTRLVAGVMLTIAELWSDDHSLGIANLALGDSYRYLDKPELACTAYNNAAAAFEAISDRVGWARTRVGLLLASHDAGHSNIDERLRDVATARRIFFEHHETDLLIRLSINLAAFHQFRFEAKQAREALQLGLELVGDAPSLGRAKLLRNLGDVHNMEGSIAHAIATYKDAEQLFMLLDQPQETASIGLALAQLAIRVGHYLEAVTLIQKIKPQLSHGDKIHAQQLEALAHHFLNAPEKASRLMNQLLHQRESLNKRQLAQVQTYSVDIEAALGNYELAQNFIKDASQYFVNVEGQQYLFELSVRHALILLKLEQPSQAANIVLSALHSEEIDVLARVYYVLAKGAEFYGNTELAILAGIQSLRFARQCRDASLLYSVQLQLGRIRAAQGETTKALLHYQRAHDRILKLQTYLNIDVRPGFLERNQEALHQIIHIHTQTGNAAAAWEALEQLKSRVLWQYLATPRVESSQQPNSEKIQEQHYSQLQQRYHWLMTVLDTHDWNLISREQALTEMGEIEQELYAARENRRLETSHVASQTVAPSLVEVTARIPPTCAFIEYYIGQDGVYAYVLTASEPIQMVRCTDELDKLLQTMKGLTDQIYRALAVGSQRALKFFHKSTIDCLSILYQLLLERLEPYLHAYQHLIVVPFGPLHVVPFHLLCSQGNYLLEQAEISILPAAGLLLQPDVQRPKGVLALTYGGHNNSDYRIHDVAQRLRTIFGGEVYSGDQAVSDLLRAAPRQVLHIGAHGLFNLNQPHLATLRLADRQVYADELLNYDLSYELAVLSACSAGLARASGGDELIGLGRGFLYAGVRSLVTGLWDVEDEITAQIIQDFYDALYAGERKSSALRTAQLSLLCGEKAIHPAYAGAFQLLGSPSPLSQMHMTEEIV